MHEDPSQHLSVPDVLDLIDDELTHPGRPLPTNHDLERRVYLVRELQRKFRQEPVGGRLVPLKRLITWFSASAFDRQGKVVEALIDLVEDLVQENQAQAARIDELARSIARLNARTRRPES